jgi:hypothetical protein
LKGVKATENPSERLLRKSTAFPAGTARAASGRRRGS